MSKQSSESPKPSTITSGWGCIEALSNANGHLPEEQLYVHPLVKRSASMLSESSLEMCTENLGSETGTEVTEEDFLSIMSTSDSDSEGKSRGQKRAKARKARYEILPPPLTILRGINSIRVQPHREEGRLLINVVSTSPRKSTIHARRSNGRLTMSLVEEDEEDKEEEDEDEKEEEEADCKSLGVDGMNAEVGAKFGIGEIQRPSRCKESERGSSTRLMNWETFWVA